MREGKRHERGEKVLSFSLSLSLVRFWCVFFTTDDKEGIFIKIVPK